MARFAATMVLLSVVFWFTSCPLIPLGREFPNCVSARFDTPYLAVGVLSNQLVSTVFVTRDGLEPGFARWSERADFHFCDFSVPTGNWGVPESGVFIVVNSTTIGWDCPYWLMTLLWSGVLVKYFRTWQFRASDLVYSTTIVALIIVFIRIRFALPLVVYLNLVTAGLLLVVLLGCLRWYWTSSNPMWPLAIAESEPEPGEQPVS